MNIDELYKRVLYALINYRITVYGFGNESNSFGYELLGSVLTICRYWNNCTIYQLHGDTIVISRYI